jgi:hypothetical protein
MFELLKPSLRIRDGDGQNGESGGYALLSVRHCNIPPESQSFVSRSIIPLLLNTQMDASAIPLPPDIDASSPDSDVDIIHDLTQLTSRQ